MKSRLRISAVAVAVLAVFWTVALRLSSALGLLGWKLWVFRTVLAVLGAILAGAIFWFLDRVRKQRPPEAKTPETEELSSTLSAARHRLESSSMAGKAPFNDLPLILLLGARGSAKTTAILESGLQAELLGGDVRGGAIAPTRTANVWFSEGSIFVEAGGGLLESEENWPKLLKLVRPRRLLSYVSRRGQAPRMAVVCVSVEDLTASGEGSVRRARDLRARLMEAAQHFGVRLPVYVLFTKLDTLPHFDDFVRNLTDEEARRVLGATLEYAGTGQAASYAEAETDRLDHAFMGLAHSLALKRLRFLGRETMTERAASAYEFPREFQKVRGVAVRFLVELCRPSQLRVSPFLRGFYFSGGRQVAGPEHGVSRSPQPAAPELGATRVFRAADLGPPSPQPERTGSSVRQWAFLPRLFRDVVLRDQAAMGVTRSGARVRQGRRVVLATAVSLLLVIALPWLVVSYRGNRSLQARTLATMGEVTALAGTSPTYAALRTLDSLRANVELLSLHQREGRPRRLALGLYSGSAMYPHARDSYFRGFERLLFDATHDSLTSWLRLLPDSPTERSDYRDTYDRLRTYLITTERPDQSTPEFLSPVLLRHAPDILDTDDRASRLAVQQFDFYGQELAHDNPFQLPADDRLVARSQRFLAQMGAVEPFYFSLLARATQNQGSRPFDAPGLTLANQVVRAFTSQGRAFIEEQLSRPEMLIQTEPWVVGEVEAPNPEELAQELRTMYLRDYVGQWQAFLSGASVVPASDAGEAARVLAQLAGDRATLTRLLFWVGTEQSPSDLSRYFQPLTVLLTPDSAGRLPAPTMTGDAQDYFEQLNAVRASLADLAEARGNEGVLEVAERVREDVERGRTAARRLTREFEQTSEGEPVRVALARLLNEPLGVAERIAIGRPLAVWNARGVEFCGDFNQRVGSKYPFRGEAGDSATLADLEAVFGREESLVWNLFRNVLEPLMERSGSEYVARAGAPVPPRSEFINFYSRARQFSEGVYPEAGSNPSLAFSFRPERTQAIQSVTFAFNGQRLECTATSCTRANFRWDGAPDSRVELTADVGGRAIRIGPYTGTWALFRFFRDARGWGGSGQAHRLRWTRSVDGESVALEATVDLGRSPPMFSANFLDRLRCVSRITG